MKNISKRLTIAFFTCMISASFALAGCSQSSNTNNVFSKSSVNAQSNTGIESNNTADSQTDTQSNDNSTANTKTAVSGTCGENVTWEFDGTDTLIISGTGAMDNYGSYDVKPPWNEYKDKIKTVIVKNDVTTLGDWALRGYPILTTVTMADSVTSIGKEVFNGCRKLANLTLSNGVTSIDNGAFALCKGLISITLPDGMTSIGDMAFSACSNLTSITIPESVTSIGEEAFSNCQKLTIHGGSCAIQYAKKYGLLFSED